MTKSINIFRTLRLIAKVWIGLFSAFVLYMLIMNLVNPESTNHGPMSLADKWAFAFFPIGALLSMLLQWKWDALGGFLMMLSSVGLLVVRPDLLLLTLLIFIPGLLLVAAWYVTRDIYVASDEMHISS